jgi:putative salt-induced outer membrane protein
VSLLLFVLLFPAWGYADELNNESEAGVVVAAGNSRSQSLSFKQLSRYKWEKNLLALSGDFLQSKSFGVLNAKRWRGELRYERRLTEQLSPFLGQGVESDRFAGFLQRYNSDLGAKVLLYRRESAWDWTGEGGYRYSRERRLDGNRIGKSQVRLYSELIRHWSSTASSRFWVEYLPNFSNAPDWAINSELSTAAAISSSLSVKLAYLLKFDNEPAPGAMKKLDTLYTTSLVAKF